MTFTDRIFRHQFDNGLVLVADRMPWLQTAAFSVAMPAGCRFDPAGKAGLANLSCELAFRETESLDSHALVETLDGLGCDYYSNTTVLSTYFGGALPADQLDAALAVYADVVRHPRLAPTWLEEARLACIQEIEAMEDDLAGKAMSRLRQLHYGEPWGRLPEGDLTSVNAIGLDDIRAFASDHYRPEKTIVAVAGKFEFDALRQTVGRLMGDWKGRNGAARNGLAHKSGPALERHISVASKQTHIGLAWPALSYEDPRWHLARGAMGVLSDGLSSRLFREVRERRGLCYAVMASLHSAPGRGASFAYCGTTSEAAQESLDVMVAEIRRLREGISADELRRLKTQVRSGLIMQQESCRARVGTLVNDLLLLGRLRPVDELGNLIESISLDEINSFLADEPAGPFELVTLGEHPLELDRAVSPATA